MPAKRTKDNKVPDRKSKGLFSLLLRQIIATFICVAFILGMKYCGNDRISSYADSLGYAIRQNPDWNASAASILGWFEDKLPVLFDSPSTDNPVVENEDINSPKPVADEITFQ